MILREYPTQHDFEVARKSGLKNDALKDCLHLGKKGVIGRYGFTCAHDSFSSVPVQLPSGWVNMISCPNDCTYFEDREEAEEQRKQDAQLLAVAQAAKAKQARQEEGARKRKELVAKWKAAPGLITGWLLRAPGRFVMTILDPFPERLQRTALIVGGAIVLFYLFRQSPQLVQLAFELVRKLPF